jgi:hypothetical protein
MRSGIGALRVRRGPRRDVDLIEPGIIGSERPIAGSGLMHPRGEMVSRSRSSRLWAAVAGFAVVATVGLLGVSGETAPGPTFGRDNAPLERRRDVDHLYRIAGEVRLLLFWVSADDVGGARITWRRDDRERSVSLLIGSEPRRAPRGVNEWGYIREDVAGDSTTVFGIRTKD